MRLSDIKVLNLPKFLDARGNLSFIEQFVHIPFAIERAYWIYDVPGGAKRGGHAYKKNEEFIVALSGSFDLVVDDGKEKKVFSLNRSYYGLYIPNGLWREMNNYSTNALCLVLSSTKYDEWDYVDNYTDFLRNQSNE